MTIRRLTIGLLAAAALALPTAAHAQLEEGSTGAIVIVRTDRDQRVVRRVRAELEAWAVPVVEIGPDAQSSAAELIELAAQHHAQAALRVRMAERSVELWVARPIDQPSGTLDTITAEGLEERGDEVLAVRVTEALRAWDLGAPTAARPVDAALAADDEAQAAQPPASEPPPPSPSPSPSPSQDGSSTEVGAAVATSASDSDPHRPPSPRPPLWFELGPALTISHGGIGPQLGAWVSAGWRAPRLVSIAALVVIPIVGDRLETTDGNARFTTWLLSAVADVRLELWPLELALGTGLAAVIAQANGAAPAAGLEAVDETAVAAAPLVRASVHVALGTRVRLGLRAHAGVTSSSIALQFVEHGVARWGRPFASFSSVIDVAF